MTTQKFKSEVAQQAFINWVANSFYFIYHNRNEELDQGSASFLLLELTRKALDYPNFGIDDFDPFQDAETLTEALDAIRIAAIDSFEDDPLGERDFITVHVRYMELAESMKLQAV